MPKQEIDDTIIEPYEIGTSRLNAPLTVQNKTSTQNLFFSNEGEEELLSRGLEDLESEVKMVQENSELASVSGGQEEQP